MRWTRRDPEPIEGGSRQAGAERAWNGVASAAVAIGLIADISWLGWVSAVRVFFLMAFACWIFALCLSGDIRTVMRRVARWSLVVPTATVALVGFWALAQGWAIVAAIALIGCHPRVVSWATNRSAADASPSGNGPDMTAGHPEPPSAHHPAASAAAFGRPSRLSDDALRQCWEASWALLQRAKTLNEAVRIVNYRRMCLDEIGRRNPTTFEGWLEAGAPNADEPARHLPAVFGTTSSCD
ncbi:MAG TPA: hypothetical protein VLK34_01240 [Nocardioidaceae bacterium]|nr:hypothetical protein [Nocardioidaceae bacterium]